MCSGVRVVMTGLMSNQHPSLRPQPSLLAGAFSTRLRPNRVRPEFSLGLPACRCGCRFRRRGLRRRDRQPGRCLCRAAVARERGVEPLGLADRRDADSSRDARSARCATDALSRSTRSWPTVVGGAWDRLVDRLLASPRYGERWAVPWLDAARFADSNGYQRDGRREAWGWRDWVIGALNDDLPFDRFTIEQLAGDLLPAATVSQRVATGFHRNTMANVEAGVDPEEERVLAVVDRVNTTGTVWLGNNNRMCSVPRPQVRSDLAARVLRAVRAVQQHSSRDPGDGQRTREFGGAMVELPRKARRRQAI